MNDFLNELLQNGETTTVNNPRSGESIEGRVIKLTKVKLPLSSKAKVEEIFDLKLTRKDGKSLFTLGKTFFDSISALNEVGTGLTPVFMNNKIYMFLCNEKDENKLTLKPFVLNTKKGINKSLTFKSQSLEMFVNRTHSQTDEIVKWSLTPEIKLEGLFELTPATLELSVETENNSALNVQPELASAPTINSEYVDPRQTNLLDIVESNSVKENEETVNLNSFTDDILDNDELSENNLNDIETEEDNHLSKFKLSEITE
jgi:hypothetical protein